MLEDYPNGIAQIYMGNYICKNCGYIGIPKTIYKGDPRIPVYSFFLLPVLWIIVYFAVSLFYCLLVFLASVFYIIYAIWWENERLICPECGSNNIVYCDKFMQQIDPSTRVKIIRNSDKKGNQEKELKKEKEDFKMKWVFLGLAFFSFVSYFAQKEGIHNASTTMKRMDSACLARWCILLTIVFFVAFIISCLF